MTHYMFFSRACEFVSTGSLHQSTLDIIVFFRTTLPIMAFTGNTERWRAEYRRPGPSFASVEAEKRSNNSKKDEEDMQRMGIKQSFRRTFMPGVFANISFGTIGVGFMNLAIWEQVLMLLETTLPNGGTGSALKAFLVTMFTHVTITMSLARLTRIAPTYGGPMYWTGALGPEKYRGWLSFLAGSMNTLGLFASLATMCALFNTLLQPPLTPPS